MKDRIYLSILLVVRNEERYIANLLDNVLNQDKGSYEMELIVVDGESTDQTKKIVKDYAQKYPQIKLINNPQKTLPVGWNLGIDHAEGNYVLRIDGHTSIPTDFLANYAEVIAKQPKADVVGGIIQSRGTGKQGKLNEYVYSHRLGVGNSMFRTLEGRVWEGYVDTVPYGAYKSSVFKEVGGFEERLKRNEDIEFHKRMRDKNKTFFLSTTITSTYFVRTTLKGLIQKSLDDGKWNIIANRTTPGALGTRHKIPIVAFLVGLLFVVGSLFSSTIAVIFAAVVAIYAALTLVASRRFAKLNGYQWLVPCAMTFFVLHFFRGFGSFSAFFSKAFWKART
ncbi:glycosyltransferase involved in cell wall biosynthesis [Alkalihalobacillus xiaoxiensis]|uniref:Glycosyltransferase involved in cell wall biosynthesis n=1 Tax=Shouchella xiaoxiensis TaxID=766895 RepID=A0ABS2T2D0_9BACI|nr:glycosyltransferase family 2 protein [Shouchella xiaoxiensis]MBM7841170.1 glycosyltransferase involved in cell wall biosynthesis [Shouchella xiaoxiensis]